MDLGPSPVFPLLAPELRRELAIAGQNWAAGRLEKADAGCRKVLRRIATQPDALNLLGLIAMSKGDTERAAAFLSAAVAAAPRFVGARFNLGNALRASGRTEDAATAFRAVVDLQPRLAEAHANLGLALFDAARHGEAAESLQRACALAPALGEAHLGRGLALLRLGRAEEAEGALRRAAELSPSNTEALVALGDFLADHDQLDEAMTLHQRSTSLKPSDPRAWMSLATTQFRSRDMDGAIESLGRALDLRPNSAAGVNLLGRAYRALGRFDEARRAFERALELEPAMGDSYRNLATTGQESIGAETMGRLQSILSDPLSPEADRITAGFGLGKVLDDAGRYDDAFAAYSTANALALNQFPPSDRFDPVETARSIERLREAFTPTHFSRGHIARNRDETPVFVVGMPRSGTSLVEQIAASHPQVVGLGERRDIGGLARSLWNGRDVPTVDAPDAERVDSLAEGHLAKLKSLADGGERAIDKMPDNLFQLGAIATLFPSARVIFCRRDGADTALSCFFQLFTSGNAFSYDLEACGQRDRLSNALADHWLQSLPLRMLEVGYERLVGDLEGESRRLIDFLGLEWDPACLEFHATERVVMTASSWQVRQPLYTGSVGRWRRYRTHIRPLLDGLGGAAGD